MAKQIKTLVNPIAKGDGVSIHVYFKQGISVNVPNNAAISKALKDIEDTAIAAIDIPAVP